MGADGGGEGGGGVSGAGIEPWLPATIRTVVHVSLTSLAAQHQLHIYSQWNLTGNGRDGVISDKPSPQPGIGILAVDYTLRAL